MTHPANKVQDEFDGVVRDSGAAKVALAQPIRVWELPELERSYVIGVNAPELDGVIDIQVMKIGCKDSPDEQVAAWSGRADSKVIAEVLFSLGSHYFDALMAIEYRGQGIDIADELHRIDYPNLLREKSSRYASYLHHATNAKNRDVMIEKMAFAKDRNRLVIHQEEMDETNTHALRIAFYTQSVKQ